MNLLHTSDTHGDFPTAYYRIKDPFDVWVDSGDFFPNAAETRPVDPAVERDFQVAWLRAKVEPFGRWLNGRPWLYTPGNHDFVDIGEIAAEFGIRAHNLCESPFDLDGERFVGFREIPYLFGEWVGEVHDFEDVLDRVFAHNPTVLVSHSPPAGILDGIPPNRYGIPSLTQRMAYHSHRIHTNLFGHIHVTGGAETTEMGIRFFNGATHVRIIKV